MQTVLSLLRSRAVWLLCLTGLGLTQTGCAHPVWVEPSVAVQTRIGGPVYGPAMPMYGPPPVVVTQTPIWTGMPAPVYMPPRVVVPVPVYRPGWRGGHPGHHHEHWRGGYGGWR